MVECNVWWWVRAWLCVPVSVWRDDLHGFRKKTASRNWL
jgi:hypothetical protein